MAIGIPGIIAATTIHEFTRALLSTVFGDNYPKSQKRLTLNPIRHFEPIGFLLMFYSVAQAQIQGYILNIQGWGSENLPALRLAVTIVPLLILNYVYTGMVYTGIERSKLKQRELILLECRCFIAHETGAEKIARQAHYLEGINNGITYHFQLTKRTFQMLKKEKTLKLQIHTGLFGGMYIIDLENPDFFKRVRRLDRKYAKIGAGFCLLVAALGVYLFWFL